MGLDMGLGVRAEELCCSLKFAKAQLCRRVCYNMDNHPDFIEARRVKKQNEDQLSDINNKIASLELVC